MSATEDKSANKDVLYILPKKNERSMKWNNNNKGLESSLTKYMIFSWLWELRANYKIASYWWDLPTIQTERSNKKSSFDALIDLIWTYI